MGDGPVANIPAGLDAYAGYVNVSGIGVTYPQLVAAHPLARHLSISTNGAPAETADVEPGAMTSWKGYTVGYTSISQAQALIDRDGRPRKLWTAHYTNVAHRCDRACGFGFTGQADATQWTDHGGVWDESLLADDFFDFQQPQPSEVLANMVIGNDNGKLAIAGVAKDNGDLLVFTLEPSGTWSVIDVTEQLGTNPRAYKID